MKLKGLSIMKTTLIILAVMLIVCGCQSGNTPQSLATTKRPVEATGGFGEEVKGMILKIDTARSQYKIGEDIIVIFTFKNISDKAITIADITDEARSCYHGFDFLNTAGKPIAQQKPDSIFIEKALILTEVQPGKTTQHEVILNRWKLAGLDHPYTNIGEEARTILVTGVYSTPEGYAPNDGKTWLSSIKSKPIRIEIAK
jgi:hypothetical protein